jgi:hypothetical protein
LFARIPAVRVRLHGEDRIRAFIGWTILSLVYIGVSFLIRGANHKLPLILYGFSLVMIVFYTILVEFTPAREDVDSTGRRYRLWGLLFLAMWMIMVTVVFGLFMEELYHAYPAGFGISSDPGPLAWLGFAFDNLGEALLLDVMNIYDLSFSGIRTSSFGTKTLVLGFRLFVDLIVLKFLIGYARSLKGNGFLDISRIGHLVGRR